jgi:hypothetical protein
MGSEERIAAVLGASGYTGSNLAPPPPRLG